MLVHPTIPHLGKIVDYQIKENEQLVICIGDARARKKIIQNLEAKRANFFRFISKRASVSRKAQLGKGVVICPFVTVSSQTEVGDFVFFNNSSGIGHNSSVGAYSVLNPYAGIAGDCCIGRDLVMGFRSTILPKLNLGDDVSITAHALVKKNVETEHIVLINGETKKKSVKMQK